MTSLTFRFSRFWFAMQLSMMIAGLLGAQEAGKPAEPAARAAEAPKDGSPPLADAPERGSPPVFYLRDSSRISGHPKAEFLEVKTQYGDLRVPTDHLLRIRFARRVAPEVKEKIQKLIEELGSEDFDKREAATKALIEIGPPAHDDLKKASKAGNEEVKTRSEGILTELGKKQAETKGAPGEDSMPQLSGGEDELVTTKMTIKGTIPHEEFAIESRYGELKVATADLMGIQFRAVGQSTMKVDVPATNQPPNNWLDTKVEIGRGQKLKIEASGQMFVRNYGISAGPEGTREWGGTSFQNLPMLALVGKVGKKGQAFLIGSGYNAKVKGEGRLYVGVVAFSPYPGGANGSYKVTIQASGGD